MQTRQIIAFIVAIGLLVGGIVIKNILSANEPQAKPKAKTKVSKSVEGLRVHNHSVQTQIPVYGKLSAYEKIELFAEVSGTLKTSSRPFKVGARFSKGDVLLQIDKKEFEYSLRAQRAALLTSITQMMPDLKIDYPEDFEAWEQYRLAFNPEKPTAALPEIQSERARNFIAIKNIYNQYYTIKSQEARLEKYTVYAPFTGEITASNIFTGSIVRANQKLGDLMNTQRYELEASVPLQDLPFITVGDAVQLYSDDIQGQWTGKIARISHSVENTTQTAKLFITVPGKDLKENMYLRGQIGAQVVTRAIEVDRNLLRGDSAVFVIQDTLLALQPVQLIKRLNKTVLLRGIPEQSVLLKQAAPGLYPGMSVNLIKTFDIGQPSQQ